MQNKKIRSVLVIDDDRDDFDLVTEAIHGIDPTVSVYYLDRCEDGISYKDQHFDLIFLDINMPSHDGFSWLKGIRSSGDQTPVIMYTNSASPAHIVKAYSEGATLYFNKPERYQDLLNGIRKLLGMDWTDPQSIRQNHLLNGKFSPFQVA
jgi:DNA-binding response OmpR family regulator